MLKDFFANSRAVAGSLLIASTLISGCNTTTGSSYYGSLSTNTSYTQPKSVIDVIANAGKYSAYSVPRADRDKHEQCVYFALDNMEIGEACDWYSPSASGQVSVVAHRPISNGYCTTLFNTVWYKGQTKNWQDTACKTGARHQWKFAGL